MERKKTGRLLAAFVVALVAALGLVLGLGSTARADDAKEYTTLSVGDVLHVGDTINSTTSYAPNSGSELHPNYSPWTLVRCSITTIDPSGVQVDESDSGPYYTFKKRDGEYSVNYTDLYGLYGAFYEATDNSDGIYVKELGEASGNKQPVTFAVHEKAPDPVKYLDANGKEHTCESYYHITDESETIGGWLVVEGKVTVDWALDFPEDTHIILCDGAELNVKGLEPSVDVEVPPNLTIYAQSTGGSMGKLVSKKTDGGTSGINDGIFAGTLTINGGVIEAEGEGKVNGAGLYGYTSLIINGGKVTCTGQYGIAGDSVTINGGTVTTAGNARCIYALGGEDSLTIAKGISVIEGDDEASAQPVADPSTWEPSKKWARTTASVPVTSVKLSPATATLEVGKAVTLKATVKPDEATDKSVTWASSDEKVATVKDGVVTAVAEGKATITATSVDNPEASAECVVTVKAPAPAPSTGHEMYRLYNPNSGEHFFTSNKAERDSVKAAGWTYEGVGWAAPADGAPVYRLYNQNGGEHHYTTSKNEHDVLVGLGWKDEGIGWRTAGTDGVPVYRQYNPNAFANNHNFTVSTNERNTLLGLGWKDENIAWYGARVLK